MAESKFRVTRLHVIRQADTRGLAVKLDLDGISPFTFCLELSLRSHQVMTRPSRALQFMQRGGSVDTKGCGRSANFAEIESQGAEHERMV